ncbi:hypothetical protein [Cellvibrio japonicus]|uniref:hypothetical protein n=1 Tax=Cellvibrio japonicus TaxID=155077 RepID=UPI00059F8AA0|nr:hypothetical protein [Cellvibrio japonicus]QEI11001.1 hypothetical protein FY117_01320 [Cellvibrio japonicus]QEI14576.1 hypothetical protein FY116_01320 [Cellvibrio japonicus]QEI18155.1 hypothetical protein FY115_01320 [Cellvibrio japonicus]
MVNTKLQLFAIALGLSTWAVAVLVITKTIEQSESTWVFLAILCVSILSMLCATKKILKSHNYNKH